ncbi:hypothetical protein MMC14_010532, partial [Varicellaria rhodocarpa]|nr:hypothetical protein [Varicellaria rhodocarpa]
MATVITPFNVAGWDEDRTKQDTPRVTPAHVKFVLPDLDGTVEAEYLMTYLPGGNATFIFTDYIAVRKLHGKQGSFITQGKGSFDSKTHSVSGTFEIVHGTGTEGLTSISGTGSFGTSPKSEYKFE